MANPQPQTRCPYCQEHLVGLAATQAHVESCWQNRVKPLGHGPAMLVLQGRLTVQQAEAGRDGAEPYRPSNATEGDGFMARWCLNGCREMDLDGEGCSILNDTLALPIDDPGYPAEWRQDGPAGPRCTAYRQGDEPGPLDPAAVVRPLL